MMMVVVVVMIFVVAVMMTPHSDWSADPQNSSILTQSIATSLQVGIRVPSSLATAQTAVGHHRP